MVAGTADGLEIVCVVTSQALCWFLRHLLSGAVNSPANMSDVLSVASGIINVCLEVKKATSAAKCNKEKCRAIGELVGNLLTVLEGIRDNPRNVLEGPLRQAEVAMEQTLDFVKKEHKMGKVARFVRARAVKDGFSNLEKNLNTQIQCKWSPCIHSFGFFNSHCYACYSGD